MHTITVIAPSKINSPRFAAIAAALFVGVLGWFQREAAKRVHRRIGSLRHSEAAAVREYAMRFAGNDPRFAADLMAAADRHERGE